MSKISTVYDTLLTRLDAVLTSASSWNRLPNPYNIEENPSLFLRQGYGIAIGSGSNQNQSQCGLVRIKRTVSVVISRKVDATELGVTDKDTGHKQLLEDMRSVLADFEKNVALSNDIANVIFVSDSGINFVNGEDENYVYSEMQFAVDYFENIN
jgi:hypothetical protein